MIHLLDRLRHEVGGDFQQEDIDRLYLDAEPEWVLDSLPIEVLVPILMLKFDIAGRTHITDGVAIELMDDGTHRARAYTKRYQSDVNPFLLQAATHALVLEGYEMRPLSETHRPSFWPLDRIENFFRALEVIEDIPTGYGQILYRARGWSPLPKVDLPPLVKAASPARYPPWMTDGAWNTSGNAYPVDRLDKVGTTFAALEQASKRVGLAARRLGSATLRSRIDDMIIDYCIGLEALFGERGPEVTHKLATRIASVLCLRPLAHLTAEETFRAVKQVYDFRSRIVHGDDVAGPKRKFGRDDGLEFDIVALARTFLRSGVAAILERPELVDPSEVDRLMLAAVERGLGDHSRADPAGLEPVPE